MRELLKKINVIGYTKGSNPEVFVTKKYSTTTADRLINNKRVGFSKEDLVPRYRRTWYGLKRRLKVVEVGHVKAQMTPDRQAYRPLKGGCEIGIDGDRYVGTGGGVVYRHSYRGLKLFGKWEFFLKLLIKHKIFYSTQKYLLTNTHVALKNVFKDEQFTYNQPLGGNTISWKNQAVVLKEKGDNYLDAAIIELPPWIKIRPSLVDGTKIKGMTARVSAKNTLFKYGRTTRGTIGTLINKEVTIIVSYRSGNALFKGVYQVSDMSAGGDSGSFVLNEHNQVIGLIFAGAKYSYVIPIMPIIKHFKLSTTYL